MKGRTIQRVQQIGNKEIIFVLKGGGAYKLHYEQDWCATATIEDVCGDLNDLVDEPLLLAEEASNRDENPIGISIEDQDSFTWTFYKMSTIKGSVTIRWYGESNGYYSENVTFSCIEDKNIIEGEFEHSPDRPLLN